MFRLFRRKKKKGVEKKEDPSEITPSHAEISPIVSEDSEVPDKPLYEIKEQAFEEKFAKLIHLTPEESLDEEKLIEPVSEILPFIQNVLNQNSSFSSFISPQIITSDSSKAPSQEVTEEYISHRKELQPISLEERIEGALFSIGRPIHTRELIENFEEDSPTIKRALRKTSRKRRKSSAIVIEEISKERWVMQLNPIYHEFFQSISPELFLLPSERRVLTEIAYRQPISLGLLKKLITGIGPIQINEICKKLESNGFVQSEKKARSLIFTSTPKFAKSFGFDDESRRLKLQMLWRLKRLMGDYDMEEEPDEEEISEEQPEVSSVESVDLIEEQSEEELIKAPESVHIVSEDTVEQQDQEIHEIAPSLGKDEGSDEVQVMIKEIGEEE
jgi:chromosome segregation and condensation protein ScpB